MKIPTKKSGDFALPVIGLGTYGMGGNTERDPQNDDQRDIAAIKAAIKLGYTHIDTAELYAGKHTEILIRQATEKVEREQLFITSKVMAEHFKHDDVIKACRGSLKRLNIKQLDLYLLHWPNLEIPLKETIKAMDFLLENELIKNIGVSNFTPPWLEEAMSYTKYKIVNNQIHYNLSARGHEPEGTFEFCQKNNILITAYRPFTKGKLITSNELLDKLSQKYNKTPAQIALNWVINRPNVVALVKSSNPKHLEENLGALGWQINQDDLDYLDKEFPQDETKHIYKHS